MNREALSSAVEPLEIDLRNRAWAAFWAWFCPGAGHFYQRRYSKGTLFLVCILGTYFFGLTLGGGHVVYAQWTQNDKRWQYFCQLGVGAAALPAIVQNHRIKRGGKPFFEGLMAPPQHVTNSDSLYALKRDELARWHLEGHAYFELGTLFTMIAGLLNVLAIYDAYAGPMIAAHEETKDKPPPESESGPRTV